MTSELLLSEIQNQTDLLSLSGKTLCVTAGTSPPPISSPSTLLCQYINLQLLNAEPQGMHILSTVLIDCWTPGSSQAQLPDFPFNPSNQRQCADHSHGCVVRPHLSILMNKSLTPTCFRAYTCFVFIVLVFWCFCRKTTIILTIQKQKYPRK